MNISCCITLLILWIILSGRFECFFMMSGVLSCVFTTLLCRYLGSPYLRVYSKLNKTILFLSISYIGWLMLKVVLSCLYVVKKILQLSFDLQTITFESLQKNSISIALFANSVTLTPGTASIDVVHNNPYRVLISVIDKKLIGSLNDMDYKVARLFTS